VETLLTIAIALAWLAVASALVTERVRKRRRYRAFLADLERFVELRDLVRNLERERRSLNDALREAFPEAPHPEPPPTHYRTLYPD
jgi:Flp pilus assembly protein TadB